MGKLINWKSILSGRKSRKAFLQPYLETFLDKENYDYWSRFKAVIGTSDKHDTHGNETINIAHLYFWSTWTFYPWWSKHNVIVCKLRLCHRYLQYAINTGNTQLAENLTKKIVSLAKEDMLAHTFSRVLANGKTQGFRMKTYFSQ